MAAREAQGTEKPVRAAVYTFRGPGGGGKKRPRSVLAPVFTSTSRPGLFWMYQMGLKLEWVSVRMYTSRQKEIHFGIETSCNEP